MSDDRPQSPTQIAVDLEESVIPVDLEESVPQNSKSCHILYLLSTIAQNICQICEKSPQRAFLRKFAVSNELLIFIATKTSSKRAARCQHLTASPATTLQTRRRRIDDENAECFVVRHSLPMMGKPLNRAAPCWINGFEPSAVAMRQNSD